MHIFHKISLKKDTFTVLGKKMTMNCQCFFFSQKLRRVKMSYIELLKMSCTSLQVETYKSFRPGDIVLAKVVSFMLYEKFNSSILNVAHDPWPGLSDLFGRRAVQLPADHGGERAGRGRGPQRGGWGSVQTVIKCAVLKRSCHSCCVKSPPAGAQMVPISWCEMQCPRTHAKEFRKVARVQPEYLQAWATPTTSFDHTHWNTQLQRHALLMRNSQYMFGILGV